MFNGIRTLRGILRVIVASIILIEIYKETSILLTRQLACEVAQGQRPVARNCFTYGHIACLVGTRIVLAATRMFKSQAHRSCGVL